MTSKLGSILDPLSDKFLATIMAVSLLWKGTLSWPLAIVILGRDAFLVLGGVYYRYTSFAPSHVYIFVD